MLFLTLSFLINALSNLGLRLSVLFRPLRENVFAFPLNSTWVVLDCSNVLSRRASKLNCLCLVHGGQESRSVYVRSLDVCHCTGNALGLVRIESCCLFVKLLCTHSTNLNGSSLWYLEPGFNAYIQILWDSLKTAVGISGGIFTHLWPGITRQLVFMGYHNLAFNCYCRAV